MSIDIDWAAVTGGDDGQSLAESVRAFVDDRFQQISLPRFIKSVKVHGFDFGHVGPEIEIKDVCDPLDDFYEDEDEQEEEHGPDEQDGSSPDAGQRREAADHAAPDRRLRHDRDSAEVRLSGRPDGPSARTAERHGTQSRAGVTRVAEDAGKTRIPHVPPHLATLGLDGFHAHQLGSPASFMSSSPPPGIPGGTSSLSYFHLPLSAGLSGTTTPLAAVAGAHFHPYGPDHFTEHGPGFRLLPNQDPNRIAPSEPSMTPPSTVDAGSRPQSRHWTERHGLSGSSLSSPSGGAIPDSASHSPLPPLERHHESGTPPIPPERQPRFRERSPEDIQVVAHVVYAGDVKISLTADITLDYPTESFVDIPLKLTITGVCFDGIAIAAYIQRRAHFCFLSPEDAKAFTGPAFDSVVGPESEGATPQHEEGPSAASNKIPNKSEFKKEAAGDAAGTLFEEIRVESEIGERSAGKQVLKNVGKVEKFVLDQVRTLFEDECVFPSFWTFLV